MAKVVVKGDLEKAIKIFKQKVARDGIPSECKKRKAYEKPGEKRRAAKLKGIKNAKKRQKRR